jgi:hypothetical protein
MYMNREIHRQSLQPLFFFFISFIAFLEKYARKVTQNQIGWSYVIL